MRSWRDVMRHFSSTLPSLHPFTWDWESTLGCSHGSASDCVNVPYVMYYITALRIHFTLRAIPFICQLQQGNLLTFIAYVEIKTKSRINDRLHSPPL